MTPKEIAMAEKEQHESVGARSRGLIGSAFVTVGVTLAAVGFSSGSGLAYTGPELVPDDPALDDPSYWGDDCERIDESGGNTWTADADYDIVVIKVEQTNWVYRDVEEGDVLEVGQDDTDQASSVGTISHLILCPPTVHPTTTTTAETTTTTAETTTTTAETTTTTAETTTTIPETTTSVASAVPTTTEAQSTTTEALQTTTTRVASAGPTSTIASELPATGSDLARSFAALGSVLVGLGVVMLLTTRRTLSD